MPGGIPMLGSMVSGLSAGLSSVGGGLRIDGGLRWLVCPCPLTPCILLPLVPFLEAGSSPMRMGMVGKVGGGGISQFVGDQNMCVAGVIEMARLAVIGRRNSEAGAEQ